MKTTRIPVFFAVDDNYVDFLRVSLASIIDNAKDKKYRYVFYIIHNGLSIESRKAINQLRSKRFKIRYFHVGAHLERLEKNFAVRDYYTLTTYYRLLIPDAFFYLDKALYLDCDITVLGDLSNLYKFDIGDNLLGAVRDHSVQIVPEFIKYVEEALKIKKEDYFNAGILVMNLKKMRQVHLLRRVYEISKNTVFKIAQDQDLLNVICKNSVTYLPSSWNVMPLGERTNQLSLIHYNLIYKPWKRRDIMYQEYFWHYVEKVDLFKEINERLESLTPEYFEAEQKGMENLRKSCLIEASHPEWYDVNVDLTVEDKNYNLSIAREEVLEKIAELEKNGNFSQDVENDPPFTRLTVGDVDYKQKRLSSKVRARLYGMYSFKYFNHLIKKGAIVIDNYEGVENLRNIKGGAIVTSNHFNPFDSIPIHKAVKKYHRKRRLFKIIREGNYTFPGLYGRFMRYCNTLPLASDFDVMRQMMNGVDYWLKKGYCILVYPEQSMWWNYRKPKPTKQGAFLFAAKNNVPVLPTFITMRDTDKLDADGANIQAYTLHIAKPIYPKKELSQKENVLFLQQEHDKVWKEIYEHTYNVTLSYNTVKKEE